jgi:glycosyltransferase involved in cell wall biosynthesis
MAQRIIISVTSDLSTDQRVNRAATTLKQAGFRTIVIGRVLKTSAELPPRRYRTIRFRLWFTKGPLFYATYNIRLFWYLLWHHADILYANDLDTLLPNYLISKLKRIPLIYDSHEYFTGVPELENRPKTKKIWKIIESYILPKVKFAITVNQSIADLYKNEYGTEFSIIRNVPEVSLPFLDEPHEIRKQLKLPTDKKIIILQGAGINIQRGAEEAVWAMKYLPQCVLLIVGSGDIISQLKNQVREMQIVDQVIFVDKQPLSILRKYTHSADIGLSLDKDTNLNYRFSLPNKIFDYIQAEIPILASNLPEVKNVILTYDVGRISESHDPEKIASLLNEMLNDSAQQIIWKRNLNNAAKEFNWEKEQEKLLKIIKQVVS